MKTDKQPFTNDLISESSPYLLQHAHNPVDWKPYTQKTLEQAQKEKKLMIISIGYAACHWCHVMEHESFEDVEVAKVMNRDFISVKVDREERPDVDQIYINAVQLMTGSAGWPLNVVTLPDGRPIWGGTYFRKHVWIDALEQIQELYKREPQKLLAYAQKMEEGLQATELLHLNTDEVDFKDYPLKAIIKKLSNSFDFEYGGFKGAPKFMMPNSLELILRQAVETNDSRLLDFVTLSLDKMAYGGLYDQIEGGFSRYSVDEKWHIPHFEKMLYDNALLVSLYANAYLVTQKTLYKEVVEESLHFISTNLINSEGAFYSSLDADSLNSHGKLEEGAFYAFTFDELEELIQEDFDIFKEYYNVNEYGEWENGTYVLIRKKSDEEITTQFGLDLENLQEKKKIWKYLLLNYRNRRSHPRLDDKTLTSWNAMMLKAYVDAYKAFGNNSYLETALKNAHFSVDTLWQKDGSLHHAYKNGRSSVNGFLEDYAFLIETLIHLYQVTLDWKWLDISKQLLDYTIEHFLDTEKKMFYFKSKHDPAIVIRNMEYYDNVTPSSNSVMAKNLFLMSKYFENLEYEALSKQMLKNVLEQISHHPRGFSNWLDLLMNFKSDFYEIVIVGNDAHEKSTELNRIYIPNKILAGSLSETENPLFQNRYQPGKTLTYLCVNNACQQPTENNNLIIEKLKKGN